jgi:acyl carrier protein
MTAWFPKLKKDASMPVHVDAAAVGRKIADFIASKSKLIRADEITQEMKLFSSGLLDSLMFIELVLFIEKELQVKLAKSHAVNMNSMDSVGQIVEAVCSAAGEAR